VPARVNGDEVVAPGISVAAGDTDPAAMVNSLLR